MSEYEKAFSSLNDQQKKAASAIDGPLLVLAGPGTGKTQLLSTRVGYILKNTDTLPQNILCLTFSEAGASAMRQRLTNLLGQAAYDVNISTYHSFGSDMLRRFPSYTDSYDQSPVDELGSYSVISEVLAKTSYENPLKNAEIYAADLASFMGDCKKALITPSDLKKLASANLDFIEAASTVTSNTLSGLARISKTSLPLFEKLAAELANIPTRKVSGFTNLKQLSVESLNEALSESSENGTKPLTAWKNEWLDRNREGQYSFGGWEKNFKIAAAAEIYNAYNKELTRQKLYDYDDMILRAIKALEKNSEFKFTLAEQYQYILLDEFQDTNPAQFRLVELLTDNPVNEGRPNIMAVGDDDQAIYAFQGADHTNMRRFCETYRSVSVIPLHENYRSHSDILDVAYNLSTQIEQRIHDQFEGISKVLKQANKELPAKAEVAHFEFASDNAQYAWVADKIAGLIKTGTPPEEIAVLAPKHRYLIPLIPYLHERGVALHYEKRENVLEKPINIQIEQISRLVVALHNTDIYLSNALWPEILSYDFWGLSTEEIWKISFSAFKKRTNWTDELLAGKSTKKIAQFVLRLKDLLLMTNLEQQLDLIIGTNTFDTRHFQLPMRCPFFEYHFGSSKTKDASYMELLSDLSVLRGRLRDHLSGKVGAYRLGDFVDFIDTHRSSGINILNSSPLYEAKSAVNLMTAYAAKGQEFQAVFMVAALDEVWGSSSRRVSSTISLPPNLGYIRYQGASEDERLRLLYVAITRAKSQLYLTSYAKTMDGKATKPLKYLVNGTGLEALKRTETHQDVSLSDAANYWHLRHNPPFTPELRSLLEPVLSRYQLSPTHLNQFIDIERGGPQAFFLNSILRFPRSSAPTASYGTIVHRTLAWLHLQQVEKGNLPNLKNIMRFFNNQLSKKGLSKNDFDLLAQRGESELTAYLEQRSNHFLASDRAEVDFRNEAIFVGNAHLTGIVDKIVLDKANKEITVIDFKTGTPHSTWEYGNTQLYKYRQQLMTYKILIENSHTFAGYKVVRGVLEFIQPNSRGSIESLDLFFDEAEITDFKKLVQAIWLCVETLRFPDITAYKKNLSGIKQFESDLIK